MSSRFIPSEVHLHFKIEIVFLSSVRTTFSYPLIHLAWFHMLANVKDTTVNLGLQISSWHINSISFGYAPRSRIALSLNFLRKFYVIVHNACIDLCSHQQWNTEGLWKRLLNENALFARCWQWRVREEDRVSSILQTGLLDLAFRARRKMICFLA